MSREVSCSKWRSMRGSFAAASSLVLGLRAGYARPCSRAASTPRLFAPAFHGGGDFQAFAVFGDRAPGDVDIGPLQPDDNCVVGQNLRRTFLVDHLPDPEPYRFGRMRGAAVMRGDR